SIDESTDAEGKYIGNVIIGKLCSETTKLFLLNCVQLEKCNNKTIAKLFNDSMNLLWLNGVKYENVFLFLIRDAAPYMVKAGNKLTAFSPKLVDQLIATIKKIFLKAAIVFQNLKKYIQILNYLLNLLAKQDGTIKQLETKNMSLIESISNVEKSADKL
ncbi:DUF659 domain-containing protein, partial [Aphis craccivora]